MEFIDEFLNIGFFFRVVDCKQNKIVLMRLIRGLQIVHFGATRWTPRRPEIDDNNLAAQIAPRNFLVIQGVEREIGRGKIDAPSNRARGGLGSGWHVRPLKPAPSSKRNGNKQYAPSPNQIHFHSGWIICTNNLLRNALENYIMRAP